MKSAKHKSRWGERGVMAAWRGAAGLSYTIKWIFLFPASVLTLLYIPLAVAFMGMVHYWPNAGWPMLLIPAPWFAFSAVSVFRCRRNTDVAFRGHLAVLSVLVFGVMYVWFTNEAIFNMQSP